jgi:hypothetical protein
MAFKLKLPFEQQGMSFLWNVSKHVGPHVSNPNLATDVELVQFFLSELVKAGALGAKAQSGAKAPPVRVTGRFDAVTGFWIFYAQKGGAETALVDGIVSPARGVDYGAGMWAIAKMNLNFKGLFPDAWESLDSDTRLSTALRAELARTTP